MVFAGASVVQPMPTVPPSGLIVENLLAGTGAFAVPTFSMRICRAMASCINATFSTYGLVNFISKASHAFQVGLPATVAVSRAVRL